MAWKICKISSGHNSLENFELDADSVWEVLHQLKDIFQDRISTGEKAGVGLSTLGVDIRVDSVRLTVGWDNWSGVFIMAWDVAGDNIIQEVQSRISQ
ncbi:MAG: hypothetical protein HFF17_14840 [Oscillospiraceae bacterium]|nr:hypothetical protein [Oscillospiraceae bacterium]